MNGNPNRKKDLYQFDRIDRKINRKRRNEHRLQQNEEDDSKRRLKTIKDFYNHYTDDNP